VTIQEVLNRVLVGTPPRQLILASAEPSTEPPPSVNVRDVTRILKGRRLPKTRRVFRGFNSPPGRF